MFNRIKYFSAPVITLEFVFFYTSFLLLKLFVLHSIILSSPLPFCLPFNCIDCHSSLSFTVFLRLHSFSLPTSLLSFIQSLFLPTSQSFFAFILSTHSLFGLDYVHSLFWPHSLCHPLRSLSPSLSLTAFIFSC